MQSRKSTGFRLSLRKSTRRIRWSSRRSMLTTLLMWLVAGPESRYRKWWKANAPNSWNSTMNLPNGLLGRKKLLLLLPTQYAVAAPDYKMKTVLLVRLSLWELPEWEKRNWPKPLPNTFSTMKIWSPVSIWASIRRSFRLHALLVRLPDMSVTTKVVS